MNHAVGIPNHFDIHIGFAVALSNCGYRCILQPFTSNLSWLWANEFDFAETPDKLYTDTGEIELWCFVKSITSSAVPDIHYLTISSIMPELPMR
jgi:hypothetical protein